MVSDCKHPTVIAGVKCLQCEIERLKERIKELEHQLAESRICEICKDKAVLAADKYREQNAKLIEVLGGVLKVAPYRVNCYDLHHGKKDRHGANDPCPVVDRYEQLIDKAAILLREVQGEA